MFTIWQNILNMVVTIRGPSTQCEAPYCNCVIELSCIRLIFYIQGSWQTFLFLSDLSKETAIYCFYYYQSLTDFSFGRFYEPITIYLYCCMCCPICTLFFPFKFLLVKFSLPCQCTDFYNEVYYQNIHRQTLQTLVPRSRPM